MPNTPLPLQATFQSDPMRYTHPPMPWTRLSQAMELYQTLGYQLIEVPWIVTKEASATTCPEGRADLSVITDKGVDWGVLPASGEQGFIDRLRDGVLPKGRYVTLTPCWRVEEVYHDSTRPAFMKVELIDVDPVDATQSTLELRDDARFVLAQLGNVSEDLVQIEQTDPDTYDLTLAGYEVGSYGPRILLVPCPPSDTAPEQKELRWVYGTGLAEPRFSVALSSL